MEQSVEDPSRHKVNDDFSIGMKVYPDAFLTFVESISSLRDEARFWFDENGMHTKLVDYAHVAMMDISLTCEVDVEERMSEEDGEIFINLLPLRRIAEKLMDYGGSYLVIREVKDGYLYIDFHQSIGRGYNGTRTIMLQDDVRKYPSLPKMELPTVVELPARTLKLACDMASMLSDHIYMKVENGTLTLYTKRESDSTSLVVEDAVEHGEDEYACSLFPLSYLNSIVEHMAGHGRTWVEFHLSVDYPMKAIYRQLFENGLIRASYFLAPRMESET